MYKNEIPAEYLARQALQQAANNRPPSGQARDNQEVTREWSGGDETAAAETILASNFTEQQKNAA